MAAAAEGHVIICRTEYIEETKSKGDVEEDTDFWRLLISEEWRLCERSRVATGSGIGMVLYRFRDLGKLRLTDTSARKQLLTVTQLKHARDLQLLGHELNL